VITSGLTKTVDRMAILAAQIRTLADNKVMVGVPSDKTDRDEGPITNAALGYLFENGSPEIGMPPRPWLMPTVREEHSVVVKFLRQAGRDAFEGKNPLRTFNAMGLYVVNKVRLRVRAGIPPPLKEATVAARNRRHPNRVSTSATAIPLIDTSQWIRSITYVIRGPRGDVK
jgi:hypothetical protein